MGEIWVHSPSKAIGYWNQQELSDRDFHARINVNNVSESESSQVGYLRTGDLGFYFQNELFICGRQKDLIIVCGTNHYPQDIERTAENVIGNIVRAGCSAAFSIQSEHNPETESVVFVVEIRNDMLGKDACISACKSIKDAVASTHGVSLTSVCLLKQRTIPKTTSGKVARSWCRKAFIAKTLDIIYQFENSESGLNIAVSDDIAPIPTESTHPQVEHPPSTALTLEINNTLTPDEIKSMPLSQLIKQLEDLLVNISSSSGQTLVPSAVSNTVNTPLVALGLDSMTLVQFKGVLEKK